MNEFEVCGFSTPVGAIAKEAAGDLASGTLPTEVGLHQNYPNPFNPSTQISFGLPADTHVTLKIYNMLGAEVATLVNERRLAGTHTVTFEAAHLPSGVFVFKVFLTIRLRSLKACSSILFHLSQTASARSK